MPRGRIGNIRRIDDKCAAMLAGAGYFDLTLSRTHDARDKRELLAAADDCLFRSKADGKNRISVCGAPRKISPEEAALVLAE